MITPRRLLILILSTIGLVAAASGPASAGMVLTNHCQPMSIDTNPRSTR